jgi:uncharacterized protein
MTTSSATARQLLLDYIASIAVPEKAAALFADDGILELPYLASLGLKWHVRGREDIRAFIEGLLRSVPTFRFEKVEIFIDTPDQVFGEYSVETTTAAGRKFSQLYAGRLVAKNGKIALLRESLDLARAARAILPNGLADVPPTTTTSDAGHLAREFLKRMGGGAEPAEVAALFSEHLEWEIAGDDGALPWIGRRSGRRAVADFVSETRAQIEQLRFDVKDILTSDTRAAVLGSLASKIKRTGRIVETDFVVVLTVANGEIVRFQMLEDSFAVARAARV